MRLAWAGVIQTRGRTSGPKWRNYPTKRIPASHRMRLTGPLSKTDRASGVDPHRGQRYSLRQARYDALAEDISGWAAAAARAGETLSVLDVGCGSGHLL